MCSLEIVEFYRPESNRKNLYITGIPWMPEEELLAKLFDIFTHYGLVYRIQAYPVNVKVFKHVSEPDTGSTTPSVVSCDEDEDSANGQRSDQCNGYYAFVTFYLAMKAKQAKEELKNRLVIKGVECKISLAKSKKERAPTTSSLHFIKCQELANYFLGFNGWSTSIKLLDCDSDVTEGQTHKLRYVCVIRLSIPSHGATLTTEGIGAWEESYVTTDPTSRFKAIGKCKKLAFQRSVENAFSKVILIVLANGKVSVEVDTTKPDLIISDQQTNDEPVLMVNELDEAPIEEENLMDTEDTDAVNLHILHMLEEEM